MSASDDKARLELSEEEMRSLGYRAIDLIVDHLSALPGKPATGFASRADLERRLREPPPTEGQAIDSVLSQLERDVLANAMWTNHPRHFAWVPGPSNFVGALADAIAAGYNLCPGTWLESSGPSQVELVTLDWLREWCGLPPEAGGIFVSGGSMANLTAIATARRIKLDDRAHRAVVYCSEQIHSSVVRNLRILGFEPEQICKVRVGSDLRLDVAELMRRVAADRSESLTPFCVIGTAGTTNTGTVDPLDALADLCAEQDMWFHVDGAYGAAAALSERGRSVLAGMNRAHSLAVDPHKWLFQPIEMGCCLVRDARWLAHTFSERPEYLQDTWADLDAEQEVNFGERGVQLTRGFRALKLWMTVKTFGEDALRAAVERGITNAQFAEQRVRGASEFEVVTPAQLGILTFRALAPESSRLDSNQLNRAVYDANRKRGFSMLTTTTIRRQTVLRMCVINPRTTEEDIRRSIELLAKLTRAALRPDGSAVSR